MRACAQSSPVSVALQLTDLSAFFWSVVRLLSTLNSRPPSPGASVYTLRASAAGMRPVSLVLHRLTMVPLVCGRMATTSPVQSVLSKRPWNTTLPVLMEVEFCDTEPKAEDFLKMSLKMVSKATCRLAVSLAL
jgi:hypothetical protein